MAVMRETERLTASLRVSALMRQAEIDGDSAFVRHKGDPTAGAILLKISQRVSGRDGNGAWQTSLRSQTYDADGNQAWLCPHQSEFLSESDSEAWIARAINRDRDIWVIEIERSHGLSD